jgi:hypothetical protein
MKDTPIKSPMPAPIKEIELVKQVGEWSAYNFAERRRPELGIVEEIGEAAHCILKRLQGIRGFDNSEIFQKTFEDSLADAVIYLADWCHMHNTYFQFADLPEMPAEGANEDRIIAHLMQTCSVLFGTAIDTEEMNPVNRMAAQRLLNALNYWAIMYDVNLPLVVSLTWLKVKQRDWKKRPDKPESDYA